MPEYGAFAYGCSRSGKTIYYSVVILRDDLDAPRAELRMMQSLLFHPCDEYPLGVANRPSSGHRKRFASLEEGIAAWRRYDPVAAERLEALIASGETPPLLEEVS